MRNRFQSVLPVLDYLGALLWTTGFVLLVPIVVMGIYKKTGHPEVSALCFIAPAVLSLMLGLLLKRRTGFRPLDSRGAMLLCTFGWIGVSAIGALPLYLAGQLGYLDAFFEAVSGFTTTGITMIPRLDDVPHSLLFWRALMQWLGGLGILAFFLTIVSRVSSAHALFSAESHKIFSKRPAPSLVHTLKILWTIYGGLTLLIIVLLRLEGMPTFDSVAHALTALSTGGYSPHDASIGYYRQIGHPNFVLIEYTVVFAMLLGGMNFFIHYRVLTGGVRALWDNAETRLFWLLIAAAIALVAGERLFKGAADTADTLRKSVFQVVSIITSTGFATEEIGRRADGSYYFFPLARQIFLVLMIVGGCVGSTGGGIKVLRIGVLMRMVGRQVRRVVHGRTAVNLVTVDGDPVELEEMRRIAALFFAWLMLLFLGGAVTAFCTAYGPIESASGMFSALGNTGPCYLSAFDVTRLPAVVKLTYILGMLAGRLEILPVLILFTRRTWR